MNCTEVLNTLKRVIGQTDKFVSLHEPTFAGNEWDYVKKCLDTGWVSSVGSYVDRFEDMLAEYTGVKRAIAVVNGTAALHMCLVLAGVESGDEVLLPTLTFVATPNALSYCGAIGSDRAYILPDYSGMESWLGDFHRLSGNHRPDAETHQRLLENIRGETCYMVLMVEGEVVACGLAVESGGLVGIFDVVTAPEHRRKGYGLELMEALLEWAINTHAHHAYLQVIRENIPAMTLYKKMRFKELYRYWYRALDK